MIQTCFALKFVLKIKIYMEKISQELVYQFAQKIQRILIILMHLMVHEGVYKCALKEPFLIINQEFVGILHKIALMDGVTITIIAVQIYVLVLILGILLEIMKLIFVQLDVVKVLMLITIQEQESVLQSVPEHIMLLEHQTQGLMIVLEIITLKNVFNIV